MHHFPKDVQLITLHETPDRTQKALNELAKYPFTVNVHKFHKQSPGWVGCIQSHVNVYKFAKENNLDYVFVCEDNLMTSSSKFDESKYRELAEFIHTDKEWEVVFVGGYIHRFWDYCKRVKGNLYETRNNNHGSVSYIISRRLYEKVLADYEANLVKDHYDIYLTNKAKCLIYSPLLFYHAHDIDSTINPHSDVWRRIWFSPPMMAIHTTLFFHDHLVLKIIIILLLIWLVCRLLKKKDD